MYSWHTQHLAFHLSLLFSPLPMVIKATRTFTSFFAPPQHTAHTQHRKNWIGKKRNWKCTFIRTRLHCKCIDNVYYWLDLSQAPKHPQVFFPGQPMHQYFSTCNKCNIPLTDNRNMDFNVGRWTKWFNLSSSDALFVFQGCISTGEEKMAAFLVYFRI